MSMPTSPLGRLAETLWDDVPHSAQGFFGVSQPHPSLFDLGLPFSAAPDQVHSVSAPASGDSFGDSVSPEPTSLVTTAVPGPRKKRAQVRVACTHCQKACKKCSNTRPCERCVKYGLQDCVDSSRKPRRTGIKRGPYKRRPSKYGDRSEPALDSPLDIPSLPSTAANLHHPASVHAAQPNLASALHGALSGLVGPSWVKGRRVRPGVLPGPIEPSLAPPHPSGFPLTLAGHGLGGHDPFSRAVSPIHIRPALGNESLAPVPEVTGPFTAPLDWSQSAVGQLQIDTSLAATYGPASAGGPEAYDLHSPAIVALRRIRKPSLRTLLSAASGSSFSSPAGSRMPSPVASQSPTLFDRPLDVETELDEGGGGGGGVWRGAGAADADVGGVVAGADAQTHEAYGTMGMRMEVDALGMLDFQGPFGS